MNKYLNLYRILNENFGMYFRPLGTFGLMQFRQLLDGLGRAADHLLFSGFKDLPIEKPVFIIGNPRSGTTFVHRFLLNTERLCAFELWEMLFTSISGRKLVNPLVGALAPLSPARYHSSDAHETSLRDVETDDAMSFFKFMNGGFYWTYFQAWEDTWGSDLCKSYFDPSFQDREEREKIFRFMEGCWRRNMYYKNQSRIIVKSSMYTLQIDNLLKRYPDCRLIYLVRDPLQTVPSGMSLITGVLENSYGISASVDPGLRERYLENLYQASCHLFREFDRHIERRDIPESNLRIVTYPSLMNDLEETMKGLMDFLDIEPAEGFEKKLEDQAEKQREHKSSHSYSLEKFGLTAERIRKDLACIYDRYEL